MDKEKALALFYKRNNIDIARSSNEYDGNYDSRIASLSEQVDLWLSHIEDNDRPVFLNLLSRFAYLTTTECEIRYGKILTLLQEKTGYNNRSLSEVLFVTVESSGVHKSGSDNVRADFHKRNLRIISKRQIVAAQSNLKLEDIRHYKVIVFLDDIVGSGITLWGEIKSFCDRFSINGTENQRLFYACIAPRKNGIRHLRDNCKKFSILAEELFDDSWYVEPAFDINSKEYTQIEQYEKLIGDYLMEPSETFFMGFQKNRLLLSFHYNTPNNTLSSFWRVVPDANEPPFYRDGNQPPTRPSIDDLKKRDKEMRNSAYAYGQDIRRKQEHNCD